MQARATRVAVLLDRISEQQAKDKLGPGRYGDAACAASSNVFRLQLWTTGFESESLEGLSLLALGFVLLVGTEPREDTVEQLEEFGIAAACQASPSDLAESRWHHKDWPEVKAEPIEEQRLQEKESPLMTFRTFKGMSGAVATLWSEHGQNDY